MSRDRIIIPEGRSPEGIIISVSDTASLLGNDNSWSCENPHKFMGPPAFFLFIISVLHMGNLDDMKIVCDVRRVLDADIVWDTEIVI